MVAEKRQMDLEGRLLSRGKRPTRFKLDIREVEIQCKIAREVMIERLDDAFYYSFQPHLTAELEKVIRAAMTKDAREIKQATDGFILRMFQDLQYTLFQQEFDDEEAAEIEQRKTLIPRGGEGVERVGKRGWAAFAARIAKVHMPRQGAREED